MLLSTVMVMVMVVVVVVVVAAVQLGSMADGGPRWHTCDESMGGQQHSSPSAIKIQYSPTGNPLACLGQV